MWFFTSYDKIVTNFKQPTRDYQVSFAKISPKCIRRLKKHHTSRKKINVMGLFLHLYSLQQQEGLILANN